MTAVRACSRGERRFNCLGVGSFRWPGQGEAREGAEGPCADRSLTGHVLCQQAVEKLHFTHFGGKPSILHLILSMSYELNHGKILSRTRKSGFFNRLSMGDPLVFPRKLCGFYGPALFVKEFRIDIQLVRPFNAVEFDDHGSEH
jgi:hypothetical protein